MVRSLIVILLLAFLVACDPETEPDPRPRPDPTPVAWQRPNQPITVQNITGIKLTGFLGGHDSTVFFTGYSENGQRYFTVSDNQIIVWNIASGESLLRAQDIRTRYAFFTPDNEFLLTVDEQNLLSKWSLIDETREQVVAHERPVTSAGLSSDGTQLAVGADNGVINLIDVATLEENASFVAHGGGFAVTDIFFDASDNQLYTVGGDGDVSRWDMSTLERVQVIDEGFPPPLQTTISPDKSLLAVARNELVRIFDVGTGQLNLEFEVPVYPSLRTFAFSADNRWLGLGGTVDLVNVYDAATGALVIALRGHGSDFADFDYAPDRSMITTGIRGGALYIWDMTTIPEGAALEEISIPQLTISQIQGLQLRKMDWSPDGRHLAVADQDGSVYILSVPED